MIATVDLALDDRSALDRCKWLGNHPVRHSLSPTYRVTKRILDIVIASIALVLALPTLIAAALLIALESPGPVLYVQTRTGQHGRRFRLYKLRTMVPDASARKEDLLHLNSRTWPDFKIEHDPRVLKVGRFLRAASIDEVPQLFNVLRGDMSLVGPRPISLDAEGLASWQRERFGVKPGLTGLWQVASRNDPSLDCRARLDIAWLLRRSLVLDLVILCKTVPAVFRGRGAY
jgi:lipopolysaccharide/colanic/teichoic acid biosynthesis glycosyltransferase